MRLAVVALLSCGRTELDVDAGSVDAASDVSIAVPMTCGANGVRIDAAPLSPDAITCPIGYHYAEYHVSGPGNDTYCCPQGHGTGLKYDPACEACPCDGPKCCIAGMQCGNTITNVCDGSH